MILSDFLTLESYFSNDESSQMFEDCTQKYGIETIQRYIKAGALACRKIYIGPDAGRLIVSLSEKGRELAKRRETHDHFSQKAI